MSPPAIGAAVVELGRISRLECCLACCVLVEQHFAVFCFFFVPSLSLADWLRLRLDRWVRSIGPSIEPRSIADRRSAGPSSDFVFLFFSLARQLGAHYIDCNAADKLEDWLRQEASVSQIVA